MITQQHIEDYIANLPEVVQETYRNLCAKEEDLAKWTLQAPVLEIILATLKDMPQIQKIQLLDKATKEQRAIRFVLEEMTLEELIDSVEVYARKEDQKFSWTKIGILRNLSFRVYGKMLGIDGSQLIKLRKDDYQTYLALGYGLVLAGLSKYLEGSFVHRKTQLV